MQRDSTSQPFYRHLYFQVLVAKRLHLSGKLRKENAQKDADRDGDEHLKVEMTVEGRGR